MAIVRTQVGLLTRDRFDRADSGSLGADWDETDYEVASGRARVEATTPESIARYTGIAAQPGLVIQATARRAAGTAPNFGLLSRFASTGAGYLAQIEPTAARIYSRSTAGAYTQIATGTFSQAADVDYRLKFWTANSIQRLYVDGTVRAQATNSTHNSLSGTAGLRAFLASGGPTEVLYDEVVLTSENRITIAGLPSGWRIQAVDLHGATAQSANAGAAGTATLDTAGLQFPCVALQVLDNGQRVVDQFIGEVWGGDAYAYTHQLQRTASGSIFLEQFNGSGALTGWTQSPADSFARLFGALATTTKDGGERIATVDAVSELTGRAVLYASMAQFGELDPEPWLVAFRGASGDHYRVGHAVVGGTPPDATIQYQVVRRKGGIDTVLAVWDEVEAGGYFSQPVMVIDNGFVEVWDGDFLVARVEDPEYLSDPGPVGVMAQGGYPTAFFEAEWDNLGACTDDAMTFVGLPPGWGVWIGGNARMNGGVGTLRVPLRGHMRNNLLRILNERGDVALQQTFTSGGQPDLFGGDEFVFDVGNGHHLLNPHEGSVWSDEVRLRWTPIVPDSGTLRFHASYSTDGGDNWTSLFADLDADEYLWDLTGIAAGEVMLRLWWTWEQDDGPYTSPEIERTFVVEPVAEPAGIQYATDFGEEAAGDPPADWTSRYADTGVLYRVEEGHAASRGKVLAVRAGTNLTRLLVPDEIGPAADTRMWAIVRTTATLEENLRWGLALRASGSASENVVVAGQETGYFAVLSARPGGARTVRGVSIYRVLEGHTASGATNGAVEVAFALYDVKPDTDYVLAAEIEDNAGGNVDLRVWVWPLGETPPVDPLIEHEDPRLIAVGEPGLYARHGHVGYRFWKYVGVGTGAEAAPEIDGAPFSPEFDPDLPRSIASHELRISWSEPYNPDGSPLEYEGEFWHPELESWAPAFAWQSVREYRWPTSGLPPGGGYRFRVRARNAEGESPWSVLEPLAVWNQSGALVQTREGLLFRETFRRRRTDEPPDLGPDWALFDSEHLGIRLWHATSIRTHGADAETAAALPAPIREDVVVQAEVRRIRDLSYFPSLTLAHEPEFNRAYVFAVLDHWLGLATWAGEAFGLSSSLWTEADTTFWDRRSSAIAVDRWREVKCQIGKGRQTAWRIGAPRPSFDVADVSYEGIAGHVGIIGHHAFFDDAQAGQHPGNYGWGAIVAYAENVVRVRGLSPGLRARIGPASYHIEIEPIEAPAVDGVAEIPLDSQRCPFARAEVVDSGGAILARLDIPIYGGSEFTFRPDQVGTGVAPYAYVDRAARLVRSQEGFIYRSLEDPDRSGPIEEDDDWLVLSGAWEYDQGALRHDHPNSTAGNARVILKPGTVKPTSCTIGSRVVIQSELRIDDPFVALLALNSGLMVLDANAVEGQNWDQTSRWLADLFYAEMFEPYESYSSVRASFQAFGSLQSSVWNRAAMTQDDGFSFHQPDGDPVPLHIPPDAWGTLKQIVGRRTFGVVGIAEPEGEGAGLRIRDAEMGAHYWPRNGFLFGLLGGDPFFGSYTRWWRRYRIYRSNEVCVRGLPPGYSARLGGLTAAEDGRGIATIDGTDLVYPVPIVEVLNRDGQVVTSLSPDDGVWGGDCYDMTYCTQITPGRLAHIETWTDLACIEGSQRLGFEVMILSARDSRAVRGREKVWIEIPYDSPLVEHIKQRRVLRVVYENDNWEEFRIVVRESQVATSDAKTITIEAESIAYDLARTQVSRVEVDGTVSHDFEIYGLTPDEHLDMILESAPGYFLKGTIHSTDKVDMSYSWDSPLSALEELAALTGTELCVALDGSLGYRVSLVRAIGEELDPVDIRAEINRTQFREREDSIELATRVYPRGADVDGYHITMGDASFDIAVVDEDGVGPYIELDCDVYGELTLVPDHFKGFWIERIADGLRFEITGSAVDTNRFYLTTTETLEIGDRIQFRLDEDGTHMTFLEHPVARAEYGVWSQVLDRPDIPHANNLLPNGFLSEFDPGPVGWDAVGGATLSDNQDGLYKRYGSASVLVECPGEGDGIETDWIVISPSAAKPYFTAQISFLLLSGKLKFHLLGDTTFDEGNVITYPDPDDEEQQATSNVIERWVDDVAIAGVDLYADGVRRIKLRVLAESAGTAFYLDAAMFTNTPGGVDPYHDGQASIDLWHAALDELLIGAFPREAFEVDVIDRHRLDPALHPANMLLRGGLVRLYREDLDAVQLIRLMDLERDMLTAAATRIKLSNLPEDLTGILGIPGRRRKRKPSGGGTGVGGGGDTGGGGGNPGGLLSNVQLLTQFDVGGTNADRHRPLWHHNDVVQENAGGLFTVDVYRSIGGNQALLVSDRDPRLEWTGSDTTPGQGDVAFEVFIAPPNAPLATQGPMVYTIVLKYDGEEIGRWSAQQSRSFFLEDALENVAAVVVDAATVEVRWNHTRTVENGTGGPFTVDIERSMGGGAFDSLVTGLAAVNEHAGSNAAELFGSWRDTTLVECTPCEDAEVVYRVTLRRDGAQRAQYLTSAITGPWFVT